MPSGSDLIAVLFVLTVAAEGLMAALWLGVLAAQKEALQIHRHRYVQPTVYYSGPRDTDAISSPPSGINAILSYASCATKTPTHKPTTTPSAASVRTNHAATNIRPLGTCADVVMHGVKLVFAIKPTASTTSTAPDPVQTPERPI